MIMKGKSFVKVDRHAGFRRGDLIDIDGYPAVVLNVKMQGLIIGIGWRYRVARFFKRLLRQ